MISLFKLMSSEIVMADVVSDYKNKVIVKNPVVLVPSQQGLMLIGYIPGVLKDSEIAIKRSAIVSIVEMDSIDKNLVNEYYERFGAGIVMAENIPSNVTPIKH